MYTHARYTATTWLTMAATVTSRRPTTVCAHTWKQKHFIKTAAGGVRRLLPLTRRRWLMQERRTRCCVPRHVTFNMAARPYHMTARRRSLLSRVCVLSDRDLQRAHCPLTLLINTKLNHLATERNVSHARTRPRHDTYWVFSRRYLPARTRSAGQT